MNNNKIILMGIIILILSSCNDKNNLFEQSLFNSEEVLNPINVEFEGKEILNPGSLTVVDSTMVIIESGVPSEFISLFSLQNFEAVHSFGIRGRGPNEFSNIIQNPVSITGNNINSIQIFDWVNKRLDKYIISENKADYVSVQYVLPPDLLLTQRTAFLNDSTIIAMGGIYKGLLAFVNTNSDEIRYINPYKLDSEKFTNRETSELYRGEFAINFDNNSIVLASKYIPEILITDFNGIIKRRVTLSEFDINEIAEKNEEERPLYFYDIKVTIDKIYAVHVGRSYSQLDKLFEQSDKNESYSISEVYVYDWDGNPITKFKLNNGYFPFVEIDTHFDRIFSMDLFSPTNSLVYFKPKNGL